MEKEFVEVFTKAESYYKQYIGKSGHNPFFKLDQLLGLKKRFDKGEKSDALLATLKAIPLTPPTIAIVTQKEVPKEQQAVKDVAPATPTPKAESGVDIQTPKPAEMPKQSTANKK